MRDHGSPDCVADQQVSYTTAHACSQMKRMSCDTVVTPKPYDPDLSDVERELSS
jgi:hypothetical protein